MSEFGFFVCVFTEICLLQVVTYRLTRALNGHLEVTQNGLNTSTPCIVSSIELTKIDVKFHDPENFLKEATIHYFWFINTVNYGQTTEVRESPTVQTFMF